MLHDLDHVTLSQNIFTQKECYLFKMAHEEVGVIALGAAHLPSSGAAAASLEATVEAESLLQSGSEAGKRWSFESCFWKQIRLLQ